MATVLTTPLQDVQMSGQKLPTDKTTAFLLTGSNKGRDVAVLPSGKRNEAFWSDHGKAFVVTCSWDRKKIEKK
jgi:hypothetical protein